MMALEYFKIFQQNATWRPRLPWCCFFQVFASSPARQLELDALAIVIVNAGTPPLVAAPRELPGKRCMSAHFETVSFNAMWVDFGDVDKLFFPQLFHSFGSCDYLIFHRGNAPHQNCHLFGPKQLPYQVGRVWPSRMLAESIFSFLPSTTKN